MVALEQSPALALRRALGEPVEYRRRRVATVHIVAKEDDLRITAPAFKIGIDLDEQRVQKVAAAVNVANRVEAQALR